MWIRSERYQQHGVDSYFGDAPISNGQGTFHLFYQKRVIDASGWVSEPSTIQLSRIVTVETGPSISIDVLSIACIFLAALGKREVRVESCSLILTLRNRAF